MKEIYMNPIKITLLIILTLIITLICQTLSHGTDGETLAFERPYTPIAPEGCGHQTLTTETLMELEAENKEAFDNGGYIIMGVTDLALLQSYICALEIQNARALRVITYYEENSEPRQRVTKTILPKK